MSGGKSVPAELVRLKQATLQRGDRILWHKLDISVRAGEFIAVLGPNGSGKSSLLNVLLGLVPLTHGTATIVDALPHKGNRHIGYIPQQKSFDPYLPIRGRDLVQLGVNGHRYGFSRQRTTTQLVNNAIESVGATAYADAPIGLLSGGEQQRLRIAQALVSQPQLLLCDEPLLSLDIASQQTVTKLIHEYRQQRQAAVVFVTHEVNPVLPWVDKILYLANGKWVLDTPDKVLRSETLSNLYGTQVEVVRLKGRVIVVGAEGSALDDNAHHHEEHVA